MKTVKLIFKTLLITLLFAAITISCSKKDDDEAIPTDPIMGTWLLRALYDGNQATDVTNSPCLKDSRLVVDEKTMNLTLSAPDQNSGACQTENLNSEWVNENGTYYFINDDGKQPANITLNDNNETLQFNLIAGGQSISLLFRK